MSIQIDDEFEAMYPGQKFIAKFGSFYSPRIKKYAEIVKPDLIKKHDFADGYIIVIFNSIPIKIFCFCLC